MASYFTGKAYGKVAKRQKQRKLAEIKAKTSQFLKGLRKVGLKATCLQLQSVEGKSVNIQLTDSDVSTRPTHQTIILSLTVASEIVWL